MDVEKSLNIADNLRWWIVTHEGKQADIAERLGMSVSPISSRLNGALLFRDEDVVKIEKITGLSEEELSAPCERGQLLREYEKKKRNPEYRTAFAGRLKWLIDQSGSTVKETAAELGVDYSGFCKWIMGKSLPSSGLFLKLAEHFGVSYAGLAGFEAIDKDAVRVKAEKVAETEPEAAETEPEEEKTGKCRTVDERREMFRDRLRELIERSGKTAEETARDTEIGLPLLQGYLEGKYFPGYLMAQKLAEYFDVPTEVLSGEEEMPERLRCRRKMRLPERNKRITGDYQRFAERLGELIRRTGKDTGAVCYEIGISLAEWDEYLRGIYLPSLKIAKRMAKYFGVPVAVLLGDEELAEKEDLNVIDGRSLAIRSYSQEADDLIRKAEKIKISKFDVDKAIRGLAIEIAAKNAACALIPHGEEIVRGDGGGLIALAALAKFKPAKVGVSESGMGKCPVCGEIVSKDCPMCPHCLQRLSWELGCGDEELPEPENEAEDCWLPAVQYSEDDKRRREGKEIVSRAERISLKSVNFPEVIETMALFLANIRDICEYEPERDAIMAGLAALIRAAPQKVIVDEGGNARCPVCGLGVEHGEEMCKRCCQLLDWEIIEVGDEVYMSGDWSVRFWVGGKEENGFIWGYDMSFQRCCEHPADLVRSGRNCPELARGLEAAARIGQQEGENERV